MEETLIYEREVFLCCLAEPPSPLSGCYPSIVLEGARYISFEKLGWDGCGTKYKIIARDARALGLRSDETSHVEDFTRRLLIAFNLNLKRSVLVARGFEVGKPEVRLQGATSCESPTEVAGTPGGCSINLSAAEHIRIKDEAYISVFFSENVSESSVLKVLAMLTTLYEVSRGDLRIVNLRKSIEEYENAMSVFIPKDTFKHLFCSLEMSVNWDGVDRKGNDFDSEASYLTGVPKEVVRKWRRIYNRLKHPGRRLEEAKIYESAEAEVQQDVELLRLAVSKAIVGRLLTIALSTG